MEKKIIGIILTAFGIISIIFSAIAFLKGGEAIFGLTIEKWETVVPFVIGILFFTSGLGLIKTP